MMEKSVIVTTNPKKRMIAFGLLTAVAIFTMFGGYAADWNETHVFNPNWPPHAKYHNAQTMSLGTLLGAAGLFFTWRRAGDAFTNLLAANLFLAIIWFSQIMAFLFPGVAWTDPGMLKPGQSMDQLPPQYIVDAIGLIPIAIADMLLLERGKDPA